MAVYKDKKTGRFYIQFNFKGQTYKRRLPDDVDKDTALALEGKMKSDLLLESFGIEQKTDIGFTDYLTDYYLPFAEKHYSKDGYKNVVVICKAILPFLENTSLRKIESNDIEKFIEQRQKLKTKHDKDRLPSTIHRELNNVSKIFSQAVKDGFLEFNPCKRVSRPLVNNIQNKIISFDKVQLFLDNFCSDWAKDVAILIFSTGLRQNDALGLRKRHVDFENKQIRLIQGKSKRLVEIPLNDVILEILQKRKNNGSDLFFPSPKTGKQGTSIKKALQGAAKRAKLGNIGARVLRRSFGTWLDEQNYSSSVKAKLLGHADLRSVHRYERGTKILAEAVKVIQLPKFCQKKNKKNRKSND